MTLNLGGNLELPHPNQLLSLLLCSYLSLCIMEQAVLINQRHVFPTIKFAKHRYVFMDHMHYTPG